MSHELLAQVLCLPASDGTQTCIKGAITPTIFGSTGSSFTAGDVINRAIIFLFPIAGLILFANLLWAGFNFIVSNGDPKKMDAAKNRITASIIGFVILFIAFWVTQLVGYIFGIKTNIF